MFFWTFVGVCGVGFMALLWRVGAFGIIFEVIGEIIGAIIEGIFD